MAKKEVKELQVIMSFPNYVVIAEGFNSVQLPIWTKPDGDMYVVYKRKQYRVKNWGTLNFPNYSVGNY